MEWIPLKALILACALVAAEGPAAAPTETPAAPPRTGTPVPSTPAAPTNMPPPAPNAWIDPVAPGLWSSCGEPRGFLESERAFPRFIGPISNPVFTKDPRSLTEARVLFVNNWIPHEHLLG